MRVILIRIVSVILFALHISFLSSHAETCKSRRTTNDIIADCTFLNLNKVPSHLPNSTTKLLLNFNQISGTLPPRSFSYLKSLSYLDLSHNKINKIHINSFEGLEALQYLDVSYNELCSDHVSFTMGCFKPLRMSLQVFKHMFTHFECKRVLKRNDEYLADLIHVKELFLTASKFYFGPSFKNLTHLRKLSIQNSATFSPSKISGSNFNELSDSTITELAIRNTGLDTIDPSTFIHFHHLTSLTIACNGHVKLHHVIDAVRRLPSRHLHTLILDGNGNHDKPRLPAVVQYSAFCSESTKSLKRLTMRDNNILNIDLGILNTSCLPLIQYFGIGFNSLSFSFGLHSSNEKILMNTTLNTIDLAHSYSIPNRLFENLFCDAQKTTENFISKNPELPFIPEANIKRSVSEATFKISSTIQFIHAQYLPTFTTCHSAASHSIGSNNNVRFINISYISANNISICVPRYLPALQFLDASFCNLKKISKNIFTFSPNIEYLIVKHNHLGEYPKQFVGALSKLKRLKVLDLSNNNFRSLLPLKSEGLYSLEKLVLAENNLRSIEFPNQELKKLKMLDLRDNKITYFSQDVMGKWNNVFNRQNISIDLSLNPFVCDCSSVEFIEWLRTTPIHLVGRNKYKCSFGDAEVLIASQHITDLINHCSVNHIKILHRYKTHLKVFVPLSCLTVFCLCMAMYHFRWQVRWRYYITNWPWRNKEMNINHNEADQEPTAYMVYADDEDDDREWVEAELMAKVEEEWNMKLLGHAVRDGIYGEHEMENIAKGIHKCPKTILIASYASIRDTNWQWGTQFAVLKGQANVMMIVLNRLEAGTGGTSTLIRCLLDGDHSIIWPKNTNRARQQFWNKLKYFLTR